MAEVTIKGEKGGGSNSFKQTPDNLRSTDTFEGVLGLCIGPIKGPTRGLKSIKLDGTQLENESNELNYPGFVAEVRRGDPAVFPDPIDLKLGAGATPTNVGTALTNVAVTRTLNNLNADFIDLRFVVNQLFRQDNKGIYTLDATLVIEMKPVGKSTWINPTLGTANGNYNEAGLTQGSTTIYTPREWYGASGQPIAGQQNYKINGKTTSSPAVYELRIAVPNTGDYANTGWDVRVRLVEPTSSDDGQGNTQTRSIQWESLAAVYKGQMGLHEDWRGVASIQITGKASDQLTGVPLVEVETDAKIVQVPPAAVYNPDTRQYVSGATWDGSWAKAWSRDPAWIINDAISDGLSGLSLLAPGSFLNKWDALELSKWCSQLVPDGNGGTHPRYSLNVAIRDGMKGEDFIRYLAGAVGALAWDEGDGEWRVKADKPEAPVDLFTIDNIEGDFIHSNTDVDTRYNDITMAFLNEEMDYREDRVRLFDNASIAKIGRKPLTVVAVGCTNRQEAMRRTKLRLESATGETRLVNFTTNRRGRNIQHLDTILVADGELGNRDQRTHGRTVAVSADRKTITLRDPVYLAPGISYSIKYGVRNLAYSPTPVGQPSGEWNKPTLTETRTVTAGSPRGLTRTIVLSTALPSHIPDNLAIALDAPGLPSLPKPYRVTNVVYDDDGERVSISGIEVKTDKWSLADNVSKEDTVFQDLRGAVPKPLPPPNGPVLTLLKAPVEQGAQITLTANWTRPSGSFINGFRVLHRINGGAWKVVADRVQISTVDIINPPAGLHEVQIITLDRRGSESKPLTGSLEVTQALIDATQIYYDTGGGPPKSVQDMMPAQPGADVTSENTAADTENVAGRPAGVVVSDLDINTRVILESFLQNELLSQYLDARTLLEGQTVGVKIVEERSQRIEGEQVTATNFSLLGTKNSTGTGWILNLDALQLEPGKYLGTTINELGVKTANNEATITDMREVLIDPSGAFAKAIFSVNVDGHVVGSVYTNDGTTGEIAFVADRFQIVDPNDGNPFAPFVIENGIVKMKDVEVDTITYGALVAKFQQTQNLDPAGGYMVIPGGMTFMWGQYRSTINFEQSVSVAFPVAFPTSLMGVMAIPYIAGNNSFRDLWMQSTSIRDRFGATFFAQAATSENRTIDGFDWFAWGK